MAAMASAAVGSGGTTKGSDMSVQVTAAGRTVKAGSAAAEPPAWAAAEPA